MASRGPTKIIKPFRHNCKRCVFVSWIEVEGKLSQMYYHKPTKGQKYGSIVIRYGNKPHEYWSSPIGATILGDLHVYT